MEIIEQVCNVTEMITRRRCLSSRLVGHIDEIEEAMPIWQKAVEYMANSICGNYDEEGYPDIRS